MAEREIIKLKVVIPVFAVVTMLATAFLHLYVMTENHASYSPPLSPQGLIQVNRTSTSVQILVSSVPPSSSVDDTRIFYSNQSGLCDSFTASVYLPSGLLAATYMPDAGWIYLNTSTAETLDFVPGMIVNIEAEQVSTGDVIYFRSDSDSYGLTIFGVDGDYSYRVDLPDDEEAKASTCNIVTIILTLLCIITIISSYVWARKKEPQ